MSTESPDRPAAKGIAKPRTPWPSPLGARYATAFTTRATAVCLTRALPSARHIHHTLTRGGPTNGVRSKGFNHLVAQALHQDPATPGGHRVVFLASDDDQAAVEVAALAESLGFAPIQLGGLSEGGLLVQARGNAWGRLIFKDLIKPD